MILPARALKIREAWRQCHDEIAVVHGSSGPNWSELKAYAPGMATRIDRAEKDAEAASLKWMQGGSKGVLSKINEWRDLWIEAINLVRGVRNG